MDGSVLWSQSDYDEREEFARSVKVSLLGVTPSGPASFLPSEKTLSEDWESWCHQVFGGIIGPVFKDCFQLAAGVKLREIAELDRMLGAELGEDVSGRLVSTSRPFIEGKDQMRGNREWRKYIRKIEAGEAPGHLPVMFALHSVLFRLPLTCALQAYAWFEWKTGHIAVGKPALAGHPENPPPLFLLVKEQIVRILNSEATEDGEPGLRVV